MTKTFDLRVIALVLCPLSAVTGCAVATDSQSEEGTEPGTEETTTSEDAVTVGAVNIVCAASAKLRSSPGGSAIGTMSSNETHGLSHFKVTSTSGSWAHGYSYQLGLWGWAYSPYLTIKGGQSGTPNHVGFSFWCERTDGVIYGGGID